MIRRRVQVRGRVQGVAFRYSCAHAAEALAVAGWVRNLSDGAVEAVFEGTHDGVEAMIQWMRSGPRFARVASVDVSEETPTGESGFQIRD